MFSVLEKPYHSFFRNMCMDVCTYIDIQCFRCWRSCSRSVSWQQLRRARRRRLAQRLATAAAAAVAGEEEEEAELDWRPATFVRSTRSTKIFVSSPVRYAYEMSNIRHYGILNL